MHAIFEIVLANFGFWFNLLIPVAIGAYLLFTHRDFVLQELGIQFGVALAYALVVYTLMFSVTTDLMDNEYWNGKVVQFSLEEQYEYNYDCSYVVCSGSGEKQTCVTIPQTCQATEPEKRYISTSNSETIYISRGEFLTAKSEFGATEHKVYHSDQTSRSKRKGEGDIWKSFPNKVIPTAVSHKYTNYVTAVKHNVVNESVQEADILAYKKSGALVDYPELYYDNYGASHLTRVIDTTKNPLAQARMHKQLDLVSAGVGFIKQVNPIIYITNEDRSIKRIIDFHWEKAKKNDAVLILGVDTDGNIVWSDVIAWSKNIEFDVKCQTKFSGFNIKETSYLVTTYFNIINGYYVRKPMEEFSYLKDNITLDWYWQVLIFLGNVLLSGFVMRWSLNNYNSKRRY